MKTMPFARLVREQTAEYEELEDLLENEWRHPSGNDFPVIIEETENLRTQTAPDHLYVIWNAWSHLSQQKRSEMIMDAYIAVRGKSDAMQVITALGLTADEAKNLGLKYVA